MEDDLIILQGGQLCPAEYWFFEAWAYRYAETKWEMQAWEQMETYDYDTFLFAGFSVFCWAQPAGICRRTGFGTIRSLV